MKQILILLFFTSSVGLFGQETDSISRKPNQDIFVGVDLASPALSLFTDQKGFEVFATVPVYGKWNLAAEVGFQSNIFDESGWDIEVNGIYGKVGANWFLSQDLQNPNMGYYTGFRLAYSNYQQTVNQYLIQSQVENVTGSLPKHNANAYWIEPLVGGRVQIYKLPIYVDVAIQLRIMLGGGGEYDLDPIVVPGFGKEIAGLNMGVRWGIAYKLPF